MSAKFDFLDIGCRLSGRVRQCVCLAIGAWLLATAIMPSLASEPTPEPRWIGVYPPHQRHDAGNPGTFTALVNEDHPGIHAQVLYRVNEGEWIVLPMIRAGHEAGNSRWKASPAQAFEPGAKIEFFLYAWDTENEMDLYDSNSGWNYHFTVPEKTVRTHEIGGLRPENIRRIEVEPHRTHVEIEPDPGQFRVVYAATSLTENVWTPVAAGMGEEAALIASVGAEEADTMFFRVRSARMNLADEHLATWRRGLDEPFARVVDAVMQRRDEGPLPLGMLYFNNDEKQDAHIELVPGSYNRFVEINRQTGEMSIRILAPRWPEDATYSRRIGIRYATSPDGDPEWTAGWVEAPLERHTKICADAPFHGLPTQGCMDMSVYKAVIPLPQADVPTRISYAPIVRLKENDDFRIAYAILLHQHGTPDSEHAWKWSRWPVAPQKLGGQYFRSDFVFYWGPDDVLNGDFEQPANTRPEDIVGWRWALDEHIAQTSLGRSMKIASMSEGTFQVFSATPDEEIIVRGKMMTPAERPLVGIQSGVLAVRYIDLWSRTLALHTAELTSSHDPGTWLEFTLETRVPPFTRSGQVELRLEGGEQGTAYFDDISLERLLDSSGNGISDRTALRLGLDPADRAIAHSDPTGDGMTIIKRIRLGLDPFTADTSGNGIPDVWELEHGFNPADPNDVHERRHPDAMTAYEAYLAGLSPHETIDPDGDGIPTALELILGTDPFIPSPEAWTALPGLDPAAPLATQGEWRPEANHIQSESLRGSLDYLLELDNEGIHGLELRFQQWETAGFDIRLDGILVRSFDPLPSETAELRLLLPWLPAGAHALTIRWNNIAPYNQLVLTDILPARVHAPGTDPAATQEWAAEWVRRTDRIGKPDIASPISPYRLEGNARHPEWTTLDAGIPVLPSAAHRWYADIPLDLDAPQTITASFQMGALTEIIRIAWEPLDAATATDTTLLPGSTLALDIPDNAQLRLDHHPAAGPGIHTLTIEQAGTRLATLHAADDPARILNQWDIRVIAHEAPPPVAAWRGIERLWPQLAIPEGTRWASAYPNRMTDRQTTAGNHGYRFKTDAPRDGHIALRTQDDTLLLVAAPVRGFEFFTAPDTPLSIIETLEDGTQLIEMVVVMNPVIGEIAAKYDILTPGVTFDDGSLHRTITAADLDETGTLRLTFLRGPDVRASTCHLIRLWQDDHCIGNW